MTSAPPIIIASLLRRAGGTGVQTHVDVLLRHAESQSVDGVRLVTPFDLPRSVTYAAFGPGRLMRPLSRAAWVWWHRASHYRLLRHALRRALRRGTRAIVYAQEPLAARAALDLRAEGFDLEVAMMVHFNRSQAAEWSEMGFIARDGRLYRAMLDLDRRVIPRVDRLVSPSAFMLRDLVERIPEAGRVPAEVVPNSVDAPQRSAEGPSGDLIAIGSLEPRKNQRFLLDVLAACHGAGRRYTLTIVGLGPDLEELQRIARRIGLVDHVRFTGYVPRASGLIGRHRAFVHAAAMENFPIALLEAMGAGRPVFAPPVGGIPEMIRDEDDGRHWPLADPARAARILMETLDDGARSIRMGRAAAERHRREFTPDAVVPRLLGAIRGYGADRHSVSQEPLESSAPRSPARRTESATLEVASGLVRSERPKAPTQSASATREPSESDTPAAARPESTGRTPSPVR